MIWTMEYALQTMYMHSSYEKSGDGYIKMHRSISREDVMEYPTHIPVEDVDLVEEEDIEYRDGKLFKSNGTLNLTVERVRPSHVESPAPDDDKFQNMFNARGSYSMELGVCRHVRLTARRRRSKVRRSLQSKSSSEETLMASFDQGCNIIITVV